MTIPKRITSCRICGNPKLRTCIDLGDQYLSSVFPVDLDYRDSVPKLPLELVLCSKSANTCGSVQLAHEIDLSSMYQAYPYTSSTNSSMSGILKDVADSGRAFVKLNAEDIVLDIGGNDGSLLSFFKDDPYQLISIDPAANVKTIFTSPRYEQVRGSFSSDLYFASKNRKAKLIFSVAMFYHLHDPVGFMKNVADCLDANGCSVIQMAYLPAMLRTNMYDNIVHEHVGYYSVQNMKWIMEKAGLEIFDVLLNDVYGGSFRVFVKHKGCPSFTVTKRCSDTMARESKDGVDDISTYAAFNERISRTRSDLIKLCADLKGQNKNVWIYGASTKGNTILQYCGLNADSFTAAADSNSFKLNKYLVGSDIPIRSESEMRIAKPEYLLALPYSFLDGFMKREEALVTAGTKFIVPLPNVSVYP